MYRFFPQVWRGALLLSDYILTHPDEFYGKFILELAAGTGITSIAAAELASHILCTGTFANDVTLISFSPQEQLIKTSFKLHDHYPRMF